MKVYILRQSKDHGVNVSECLRMVYIPAQYIFSEECVAVVLYIVGITAIQLAVSKCERLNYSGQSMELAQCSIWRHLTVRHSQVDLCMRHDNIQSNCSRCVGCCCRYAGINELNDRMVNHLCRDITSCGCSQDILLRRRTILD